MMKVVIKQPAGITLQLDQKQLLLQETTKRHFRRDIVVETVIPRSALTEISFTEATDQETGELSLTYELEATYHTIKVAFQQSDEPFLKPLHDALAQQVITNGELGEADYVANAKLITDYFKMYQDGVLTKVDFEAKKKAILHLN